MILEPPEADRQEDVGKYMVVHRGRPELVQLLAERQPTVR
jgi:hypothetical protein